MTARRARLRAISLSLGGGLLILVLKWAAYHVSGSAALKSDAIESLVNVLAALIALGAILFADRPADSGHPYGHGKIEHFSAAFEGLMIALAAALIAWEAFSTFHEQFHGTVRIRDLGTGVLLNGLAGALNGLLGAYLVRTGRQHGSTALEADGHHILSDFWTTCGILGGLLLVRATNLVWLDPLMALAVAVMLARTGIKLLLRSGQALLDVEDPALLERLLEVLNRLRPSDIITVHELRTLRSGRHTHVDIHMVLPAFYPLSQAHDLAEGFGQRVIGEMEMEGELHTHIDPCQRAWCRLCALEPCPIRAEPCAESHTITREQAVSAGPI